MKPDQRLSPRKPLRTRGMLAPEGLAPLPIQLFDIAPGGVGFLSPQQLPPGHRCSINFSFMLNGQKNEVSAAARVAYCVCGADGFKVGLQFTDINEAGAAAIAKLIG